MKRRNLNYTLLFIALVLIQLLVLDSMYISVYVAPLVYVAFIVLLPTDTSPLSTLLLGLAAGVVLDFLSGGMGLNTASLLVAGYVRPLVLRLVAGDDIMRERSQPGIKRLGAAKFVFYSFVMSLVVSLVFFLLEALDLSRIAGTLLKVLCSSIATTLLVYITAMVFTLKQE